MHLVTLLTRMLSSWLGRVWLVLVVVELATFGGITFEAARGGDLTLVGCLLVLAFGAVQLAFGAFGAAGGSRDDGPRWFYVQVDAEILAGSGLLVLGLGGLILLIV